MELQDDMEQDMVEGELWGEVQDSGEPTAKQMRESWEWEDEPQSFRSQQPGFFPSLGREVRMARRLKYLSPTLFITTTTRCMVLIGLIKI